MTGIVQAPLNIVVTNRVVRIQPSAAPFLIINTNLNATVWAANNPSVQPGIGTTINPGTSLTWTSPGEVFLILGNDTLSVTETSAAVIISYDASTWQASPAAIAAAVLNSGVLIVDRSLLLASSLTLLAGNSTAYFNVSQYSSVHFNIFSNGAIGGYVDISFYADSLGAILLHSEQLFLTQNPPASFSCIWIGTMPIRGSYMRVTAITTAIGYSIAISSRQIPQIANTLFNTNNLLLGNTQLIPGAGAVGTQVYANPYYGEVEVLYQATNLGGIAIVRFVSTEIDRVIFDTTIANNGCYLVSGVYNIRRRYTNWGGQWSAIPINGAAANTSYTFIVTPVQQR